MADFDPEAFVSENSPKNGADSEFDPAAFVSESSSAEPSRPKEMGMGFAAIEGLADAVPGTSQVGAALRGGLPALGDAIDDPLNGKKWGRIVSEYQRVKGEQEARSRKAQNDAPWAYGLSNVLGSVGTAVAGGAAGKMLLAPASAAQATQLAIPGALVGNEAMNIGARYNSGTEQIGGGVGGDQMVGFLASKVIHGVAGAATRQVIPLVLKMPQAMQEKFFYAIGDTRLAKLLADNADTPAGKMLSERVRGLQGKIAAAGSVPEVPFTPLDETTIDAADAVGLKMAKAARAGTAEVGDGVNYSLKPESGLIDDMAALSKGTTDAAAEKQWPGQSRETPFKSREVVAESNLEKARAAGADEEGRIFGGDVALGQSSGNGPKYKSKKAALAAIFDASGLDGYRNYSVDAGHFDEIERLVGHKGLKFTNIQDAFNALTAASAKKKGKPADSLDWEDTQTAIHELQKLDGLKDLKLPVDIQEALLPAEKSASDVVMSMPEGSDISFNFSADDAPKASQSVYDTGEMKAIDPELDAAGKGDLPPGFKVGKIKRGEMEDIQHEARDRASRLAQEAKNAARAKDPEFLRKSKELADMMAKGDDAGKFGGLAEIEAALGGPAGPITKFEQASGRYSQDSVIARAQAREAQEEVGRSIGTREKYREFFDGVDVSIGHELRQREAEAAAAMGKTGAPAAKPYDGEGLSLDAAEKATAPPKMSIADANRVSKESRDTLARVKAGMSEATVNRKVQTEEVLDSARHWQQKLADAEKQMAAAGANKFERERLQGIAAEAQRELTRINTGRRATERVLGAHAGYGVGGIAGGLYGFEKGLPIGRSADMMAAVGSRLQQWATRNDNLGRAAQWAIQAPGEARLARIIALSNMPEAQEEIGLER